MRQSYAVPVDPYDERLDPEFDQATFDASSRAWESEWPPDEGVFRPLWRPLGGRIFAGPLPRGGPELAVDFPMRAESG